MRLRLVRNDDSGVRTLAVFMLVMGLPLGFLALGPWGVLGLFIAGLVLAAGFIRLARDQGAAHAAAERWHRSALADPADARCRAVADSYVAGEFDADELEWRILLALVPPPPDREARVRQWDLAQKAATQRMLEQQQAMQRAGVVVGGQGCIVATHTTPWTAVPPGLTSAVPWSAAPPSEPPTPGWRPQGRSAWAQMEPGEHCRFHELESASGYLDTVCACGHELHRHFNGGCNDCDQEVRAALDPAGSQFPRPEMQEIGAPTKPPPKPVDAKRSVLPATADPRLVDVRHR